MLSEKLEQTKNILTKSKTGHIPLSYRVDIMQMISNKDTVNKIFFECIKKIIPILKNSLYNDIFGVLNYVDTFLYKRQGDKNDLEKIANKYRNYFSDMVDIRGLAGLSVCALCNSIVYDAAMILNIDEYNGNDDDTFDWEEWNPDFFASMVYSGGNPFVGEGDIHKRKEFWEWYLNMVLTLYKSPDNPLLLLPSLRIESPKSNKNIDRVQSYKTDAILNKLNKVINKTINSYYRDYQGDWDKIQIEAYCMKTGLRVNSYFIQNEEAHKIRGNVESFDLMNEIKYMMYEQNKYEGAWFASKIEINEDKTYSIEFNYDNIEELPNNWQQPDRFVSEFEKFPRSKEFTPQWWQDILGKEVKYLKQN